MVRHSPFPLSSILSPFPAYWAFTPFFHTLSRSEKREFFGTENPSPPPAYNVRENSSLLQAEVALYMIAIPAKNRVILYAQLLTLLYFGRITIFTP